MAAAEGEGDARSLAPSPDSSLPAVASTQATASRCTVHGAGLSNGTVGQYGVFTIEACDADGERLSSCDDEFAVTMRLAKGGTKLRMRMLNNNDGTVLLLYSEK